MTNFVTCPGKSNVIPIFSYETKDTRCPKGLQCTEFRFISLLTSLLTKRTNCLWLPSKSVEASNNLGSMKKKNTTLDNPKIQVNGKSFVFSDFPKMLSLPYQILQIYTIFGGSNTRPTTFLKSLSVLTYNSMITYS